MVIKKIMTFSKILRTLLGFALLFCFDASAQEGSAVSLKELWESIEQSYSGIKAKEAKVQAANLELDVVKGSNLPQLKFQAQNTYGSFVGSSGGFFPQSGFFNVSGNGPALNGVSHTANNFASGVVEWEVFSFGRTTQERQAAVASHALSQSELDAYLLGLKSELSNRYIDLLYSQSKESLSNRNVARLDSIRLITQSLSGAGLSPAADSLLASSSFIQASGELDKWHGQREASIIKIEELAGTKVGGDFRTAESTFLSPSSGASTLKSDDTFIHPVLQAIQQESEIFELNSKVERLGALPSVKVLGGYSMRSSGIHSDGNASSQWSDGFNNLANNWLIGLGVTWNFTSLYTNKAKAAQYDRKAESARFTYQQQHDAIHAGKASLLAKIDKQLQQVNKSKVSVDQSTDAYSMYLARYKSGLISLSELLQIQGLLEQAESNLITASRDYWRLMSQYAALESDYSYMFNHL